MKAAMQLKEQLRCIPWEDRPEGCSDVVWRFGGNPIITAQSIPGCNSVFNSAVVPFGGGFAGVFRCDSKARLPLLHAGFSTDGVTWDVQPDPIMFDTDGQDLPPLEYAYDPRICLLDGRYWVTWCNGIAGEPTIGLAWTKDFRTFHQQENAFLPHNRNGVLFPRKIAGRYAMLSRPSDNNHTAFGDIYYSESPDMVYWGRHRLVMKRSTGWQALKIGAGPTPIETPDGWLLIYHGVLQSCSGFVYSFGAAMLDLDQPWKVIGRNRKYLLAPQRQYERVGDVNNVVFPCACLHDASADRVAIYYGGADTVVCLAFAHLSELVDFAKGVD